MSGSRESARDSVAGHIEPWTETLQRPLFGVHEVTWPDNRGTEYQLSHGAWSRLLRANGFDVLDLIELQVPEGAETHEYHGEITAGWGRKWPPEEIWVTRSRQPAAFATNVTGQA